MARTPPPPAQQCLIDRLREFLVAQPVTREVSMFGGRCFLVTEKILVSAGRDGGILVRVDPVRHDELICRPGAAQAEMGRGRSMGRGWIAVDASAIATDRQLRTWLDAAVEYNLTVTGGERVSD